jgi:calcium-dependent protein kinase
MKKEKLLQAFKMFDIDGSGKISSEELRKCLGCIIVNILENEIYSNSEQSIWDNLIKDAD